MIRQLDNYSFDSYIIDKIININNDIFTNYDIDYEKEHFIKTVSNIINNYDDQLEIIKLINELLLEYTTINNKSFTIMTQQQTEQNININYERNHEQNDNHNLLYNSKYKIDIITYGNFIRNIRHSKQTILDNTINDSDFIKLLNDLKIQFSPHAFKNVIKILNKNDALTIFYNIYNSKTKYYNVITSIDCIIISVSVDLHFTEKLQYFEEKELINNLLLMFLLNIPSIDELKYIENEKVIIENKKIILDHFNNYCKYKLESFAPEFYEWLLC